MAKRFRAVVRGRVQGVSFRAAAADEAARLGAVGWVRNLPDGAVELEAQGEQAALEGLLAWLHGGPPLARVDGLEVEWLDPEPGEGRFVVRATPAPGGG